MVLLLYYGFWLQFIYIAAPLLTWFDARTYCETNHAAFAVIQDQTDQDAMHTMLQGKLANMVRINYLYT